MITVEEEGALGHDADGDGSGTRCSCPRPVRGGRRVGPRQRARLPAGDQVDQGTAAGAAAGRVLGRCSARRGESPAGGHESGGGGVQALFRDQNPDERAGPVSHPRVPSASWRRAARSRAVADPPARAPRSGRRLRRCCCWVNGASPRGRGLLLRPTGTRTMSIAWGGGVAAGTPSSALGLLAGGLRYCARFFPGGRPLVGVVDLNRVGAGLDKRPDHGLSPDSRCAIIPAANHQNITAVFRSCLCDESKKKKNA